MMLMQVQCPSQMPAGSLCLEAITASGSAATLSSPRQLPSLPLAGAPGSGQIQPATSCPASSDTGSSSASGSGSSDGGDSGGSGDSGDSASGGKHAGKHHSKKSKSKHHAKDSADVLPISDGAGEGAGDEAGQPTLASCGLLAQPSSAAGSVNSTVGSDASAALDSVGGAAGGMADSALKSAGERKSIATGEPKEVKLATTGYSFQDNTPKNSNKISCGTIHSVAGGLGTYDDPISVAVPGHDGQGDGSGAELSCGTRIYYKEYRFYGIVEDTGASKYALPHTDIYVDGATNADGGGGASNPAYTAAQSKKCMDPVSHIKDGTDAIVNPPPNEPVRKPGPITQGGSCDVFGS
jgi:hypothetical protein